MGSLLSYIGRGFSFGVVPAFVFWDPCGHRQVPALSFTHVAGLVLLVLSLAERPWGTEGSWYLAAGRATAVAAPPTAVNGFTPAGVLGTLRHPGLGSVLVQGRLAAPHYAGGTREALQCSNLYVHRPEDRPHPARFRARAGHRTEMDAQLLLAHFEQGDFVIEVLHGSPICSRSRLSLRWSY